MPFLLWKLGGQNMEMAFSAFVNPYIETGAEVFERST
jgi:hypothetical protein